MLFKADIVAMLSACVYRCRVLSFLQENSFFQNSGESITLRYQHCKSNCCKMK